MVKCVRKHKIRKAVDDAEDADGRSDGHNTPAEELDDRSSAARRQRQPRQARLHQQVANAIGS